MKHNESVKSSHTHSYVRQRRTRSGRIVYQCNDPKCYHTAYKEAIVGKLCLCSICNETEFVLNKRDLERAKPRCLNCSNTQKGKAYRAAKTAMSSVLFPTHINSEGEKFNDG